MAKDDLEKNGGRGSRKSRQKEGSQNRVLLPQYRKEKRFTSSLRSKRTLLTLILLRRIRSSEAVVAV
jgi:hypothetical protein